MYNKIFTKILDSSIWMESMPTRIVWLTFLAAMDQDGFVEFASPANVAHRAIVPLKDTLKAIAALEGPDPNSSDPDNEGRRVERVAGGWMVLNAHKYREIVTRAAGLERNRERVRAHRERRRPVMPCNAQPITCNAEPENVMQSESDSYPESDANSEGEGEAKSTPPPPVASPPLERIPTAAFQRIRASRVTDVRQALFSASLGALVAAMGARSDRGQEWDTSCNGLTLIVVLAIFDWAMTRGQAIREPSQFADARVDWFTLSGDSRSSIGYHATESYGIPLTRPKKEPV